MIKDGGGVSVLELSRNDLLRLAHSLLGDFAGKFNENDYHVYLKNELVIAISQYEKSNSGAMREVLLTAIVRAWRWLYPDGGR